MIMAIQYYPSDKINETFENNSENKTLKIPRDIYQTYSNVNDIPYELTKCSKNVIVKNNPNYKYVLYTNKDIIKYIKEVWGDIVLDIYLSIDESYGPARADLFRYLILYDKGGIYLDIKSSITTSFDNVIKPNDEYILCHWGPGREWNKRALNMKKGEFINWFIACKPRHPFLKQVITNILGEILKINNNKIVKSGKHSVIRITGPIIYTKTIMDMITNSNDKYKYRIIDNPDNINLIYACRDHIKITKNHYSLNKKHIINFNDGLNIISDSDINNIFNNLNSNISKNNKNNSKNNSQNNSKNILFSCTSYIALPNKYKELDRALSTFTKYNNIDNIRDYYVVNEYSDKNVDDKIERLKEKYPFIKIINKDKSKKGQANSLNIIIDLLKNNRDKYKYWVHWEESWFVTKSFLKDAYNIMENDNIDQLQLTDDLNDIPENRIISKQKYREILKVDKYNPIYIKIGETKNMNGLYLVYDLA